MAKHIANFLSLLSLSLSQAENPSFMEPFMEEVDEIGREEYRVKLWSFIVKKEIPKMAKMFSQSRHVVIVNSKKVREQ